MDGVALHEVGNDGGQNGMSKFYHSQIFSKLFTDFFSKLFIDM